MKTNNQKFSDIINSLGDAKPRLLLHVCCAPCLAGVIGRVAPYFDLTLYYYNQNIMPEEEYEKRYVEIGKLLALLGYDNIPVIKVPYQNADFLSVAAPLKDAPEGGTRCQACIAMRMEESAKFARKNAFDYFCTTLSVSPHKDAKYINQIGEKLQTQYSITWLYSDFKKGDGFLTSTRISRELGIYRQDYCGCKL